ncbi:helix-turn-helix transcriptional regulator [Candidatus Parcubacteria bacterium]|nr:helix-turn-helix transcriptional regulator [Candidatus Parcubacteria bacterium]
MELKNNLQKIRKEKGVTQEELAKKVGVTRQTIICIEHGNCSPSISVALKIGKTLGVCVDDIFEI